EAAIRRGSMRALRPPVKHRRSFLRRAAPRIFLAAFVCWEHSFVSSEPSFACLDHSSVGSEPSFACWYHSTHRFRTLVCVLPSPVRGFRTLVCVLVPLNSSVPNPRLRVPITRSWVLNPRLRAGTTHSWLLVLPAWGQGRLLTGS